jgi:hypothetical protein
LGGSVSIGSYNGAVFPAIWTNTDWQSRNRNKLCTCNRLCTNG